MLFNIIVLLVFLYYIIVGYLVGFKKQLRNFSMLIARIFFSLILSNRIALYLVKLDLNNSKYNFKINDKNIYNIVDIIKTLIIENYPSVEYIINNRSLSIYIIESISYVIIRFALVFIFIIIFWLLEKLIIMIIYKYRNKKEIIKIRGPKNIILSIIYSIFVIYLISIPLSGLSSLTNDLTKINNIESKEVSFLKEYRNTIPGKMFSIFEINKTPIDEYGFDALFTIYYGKNNISLRKEVNVFVDIYEVCGNDLLNNLTIETIEQLYLKLNNSKSLNIIAPLIIDYIVINYYQHYLTNNLYMIDFYKDLKSLNQLIHLYLNHEFDLENNESIKEVLSILIRLELLEHLSDDVSIIISDNDVINYYLTLNEIEKINLDKVNYLYEINLLNSVFNIIIKNEIDLADLKLITSLIYSSQLIKNNEDVIAKFIVHYAYKNLVNDLNLLSLNKEDYEAIVMIVKVFGENGVLDQNFRISKLFDDESIEKIINSIVSSNYLINNLNLICKIFLWELEVTNSFDLTVPDNIEWTKEEGVWELNAIFQLFKIGANGFKIEDLKNNIDMICDIIENSKMVKSNINSIIQLGLSKFNIVDYKFDLIQIDFESSEGNLEIKKLTQALRILVNKGISNNNLEGLLKLSNQEIDLILESRIIEDLLINIIYEIGKDDSNPLVVNLKRNDYRWYKNEYINGELRNLIFAVKIIFKEIDDFNNIKLSPELLLSISDGTIDTNKDGVIDQNDEDELSVIMDSKILSDTIIKFIFDYYKEMNNK